MVNVNPDVLKMVELNSKVIVVAVRGNGGLKIELSCYNRLYDKLSHAPDNLLGMVFEVSYRGATKYARIMKVGGHKFLPPTKREPFPAIMFDGVNLSRLEGNLNLLEALDDYDKKYKPKDV